MSGWGSDVEPELGSDEALVLELDEATAAAPDEEPGSALDEELVWGSDAVPELVLVVESALPLLSWAWAGSVLSVPAKEELSLFAHACPRFRNCVQPYVEKQLCVQLSVGSARIQSR